MSFRAGTEGSALAVALGLRPLRRMRTGRRRAGSACGEGADAFFQGAGDLRGRYFPVRAGDEVRAASWEAGGAGGARHRSGVGERGGERGDQVGWGVLAEVGLPQQSPEVAEGGVDLPGPGCLVGLDADGAVG